MKLAFAMREGQLSYEDGYALTVILMLSPAMTGKS